MIFLDNAGTTKMFEECVEVHKKFSCEKFFNPSALSNESLSCAKLIVDAEKYILKRLDASEGNIIISQSKAVCVLENTNMSFLRANILQYIMLQKNLRWTGVLSILFRLIKMEELI